MPGETPRPCSTRSRLPGLSPAKGGGSFFIEAAGDQLGKRADRALGLGAAGAQLDVGAGTGGEHHQPHDRAARDGGAVLGHENLGVELPGELDEARRRSRMKAPLVADRYGAPDRRRPIGGGRLAGIVHPRTSARSCEATLMYLRPASCAPRTALASVSVGRKLASLISMGRLMPAMTSIFALSITEMARLEGVPPNMSVSSTTPCPASTSSTQRRMSCRRFSMSSSGPMHTAAMLRCGPTTCSSAATNSAASRPWVTRTIPIMRYPSRALAPRRSCRWPATSPTGRD